MLGTRTKLVNHVRGTVKAFGARLPKCTAQSFHHKAAEHLPQSSYASLAVATIVSGIVGFASIYFLLRYLRTHSTGIFIGYRLVVGLAILALLFANRISPIG